MHLCCQQHMGYGTRSRTRRAARPTRLEFDEGWGLSQSDGDRAAPGQGSSSSGDGSSEHREGDSDSRAGDSDSGRDRGADSDGQHHQTPPYVDSDSPAEKKRKRGQRGPDRAPRRKRGQAAAAAAAESAEAMTNGAGAVAEDRDQHTQHGGSAGTRGGWSGGRGTGGRSGGRGRGRGRGRANDGAAAAAPSGLEQQHGCADFHPTNGDPSTVTSWSMTIGAGGNDVPTWCLSQINNYMSVYDIRGAASLERGGKSGVLHIQCWMEVTCPANKSSESAFKKHLKEHIPINPCNGSKLTFKPLAEGQTFVHMFGYVQKDLGKTPYKLVHYNVNVAELEEGRKAYSDVSADYKSGKVMISKSVLPNRVFSLWHSSYRPFYVPLDVMVLHMLRSGKYAPCGTWVGAAHGRHADPAMQSAMQLIITRPKACTLDHVRTLFFGMHIVNGKLRYHGVCDWDINIALPPLLRQASAIWHTHAYDVSTMAQVVFELRQCLTLADVNFEDYDAVDTVFVECFDEAYSTAGSDSLWRTFGPDGTVRPVNELDR